MDAGSTPVGRVKGLDGMRGIAASAIVVSHYAVPATPLGRVSVAAFFALSGYLLIGQLYRYRLSIEAGRIQPLAAFVAFWVSRLLWLTPVYLIVLAIAYAIERQLGYVYLHEAMSWYLMSLQNVYVAFLQPFWLSYSHTWAIAAQNQFYLLFCIPALFLLPAARHAAFCEVLVIVCLLVDASMVWNGVDHQTVRLLPQWGGVFMALGGAMLLRGAPQASPMLRNAALLSIFGSAILVIRPPNYFLVEGVLGLVVLSFFVYSMISYVLANPDSWAVRALESRAAKHLGLVSYEIYLVHVPVAIFGVKAINHLVGQLGFGGSLLARGFQFMAIYGLSVLIATILHFGIQVAVDERRRGIVAWFTALSTRRAGAVKAGEAEAVEGGVGSAR